VLAKDVKGNNFDPVDPTSTFPADQARIHLVVTVNNAPSDTKVKSVWIAVDVGNAAPANHQIGEFEWTVQGSRNVYCNLTRYGQVWPWVKDGVWAVGKYKVDIYLDGKLNKTLEYTITSTTAAAPTTGTSTPGAPTMSGHYIRTETTLDGRSLTEDWYFTPCGDGCADVSTVSGSVRGAIGERAMDNG
jgi:hypothetical protein